MEALYFTGAVAVGFIFFIPFIAMKNAQEKDKIKKIIKENKND